MCMTTSHPTGTYRSSRCWPSPTPRSLKVSFDGRYSHVPQSSSSMGRSDTLSSPHPVTKVSRTSRRDEITGYFQVETECEHADSSWKRGQPLTTSKSPAIPVISNTRRKCALGCTSVSLMGSRRSISTASPVELMKHFSSSALRAVYFPLSQPLYSGSVSFMSSYSHTIRSQNHIFPTHETSPPDIVGRDILKKAPIPASRKPMPVSMERKRAHWAW